MDCEGFVLSFTTQKDTNDLKNLDDIIDFNSLDQNHEVFKNKNEKVVGEFKIETPKKIRIDEFLALRSKMYAPKCGDDSKKLLKGVSET